MRKEILALFGILVMMFALVGCNSYTKEETDQMVKDAATKAAETARAQAAIDAQAQIDNVKATYQAEVEKANADAEALKASVDAANAVSADAKAKITALEAQLAAKKLEEEKAIVAEKSGYLVDEIALDGNFAERIDSEDYEKLDFYEVKFEGDRYDVEEIIVLSADIMPVYNFEDQGAEIFVEIADKNAIEYRVEFDEAVDFSDADDELSINFLGSELLISDFDGDEATLYQGAKKFLKEGEAFQVGDAIVTVVTVANDKALINVEKDGKTEQKVINEDDTKDILGIDVRVSEVLDNEEGNDYCQLTVALKDQVDYTVNDGDEYEPDDRFEWVIEGDGEKLSAIGLRLAEEYTDDDEVFAVGQGLSFPNDYLKFTFDSVKNAEVKDLSFDLSSDEISVSFEGKIEFDEEAVVDGSLVFDVSGADITFSYETKTDEYEDVDIDELDNLVLKQGDRELTLEVTDDYVIVTDGDKEYKFAYLSGSEHAFTASLLDAADMNEDDDYLVNNGDILYKSSINEAEEEDDRVTIGLVNDEGVELALKVQ